MLRELYLQDLVLVPWESFPVPRTVVYQSGHWMEAAAGDCVLCALSKPFTCLGSPRGSCGGSAASLTPEGRAYASHIPADQGQGLATPPLRAGHAISSALLHKLPLKPVYYWPPLKRENLCKCPGQILAALWEAPGPEPPQQCRRHSPQAHGALRAWGVGP